MSVKSTIGQDIGCPAACRREIHLFVMAFSIVFSFAGLLYVADT